MMHEKTLNYVCIFFHIYSKFELLQNLTKSSAVRNITCDGKYYSFPTRHFFFFPAVKNSYNRSIRTVKVTAKIVICSHFLAHSVGLFIQISLRASDKRLQNQNRPIITRIRIESSTESVNVPIRHSVFFVQCRLCYRNPIRMPNSYSRAIDKGNSHEHLFY